MTAALEGTTGGVWRNNDDLESRSVEGGNEELIAINISSREETFAAGVVGKFISNTQASPKLMRGKRLVMTKKLHVGTCTSHAAAISLSIDNGGVRREEFWVFLNGIDVVLCAAKAKAGSFRTREVESGLVFLSKRCLLSTKGTNDMQAIFRGDFIEVFERIRRLRVSLGVIVITRGRVSWLELNGEEVWLVIFVNIVGVLGEIDNVGMENIIINMMIGQWGWTIGRGSGTFRIPDAGFSIRVQGGRFRE
jgi:hypothetical protein